MNIVPFNTENPPLYFKKIWSLQKCSKSSSVFLNNKKKLYWHIVKQINGGDTLGGVYIRGIIYLFMVRLEFAKKRPNLRSRGRKFPDKKRGTLWRCENHKVFLSFCFPRHSVNRQSSWWTKYHKWAVLFVRSLLHFPIFISQKASDSEHGQHCLWNFLLYWSGMGPTFLVIVLWTQCEKPRYV